MSRRKLTELQRFLRELVLELDGIEYGAWSREGSDLIQAIKGAVERAWNLQYKGTIKKRSRKANNQKKEG